jgi:iron only hydrogenase large subunit-like protein/uncharacterized Fe-S cluster-containing protein
VESHCIADGHCVLVCPQQAKKVQDGKGLVRDFLLAKQKLAVSLAPSFVALDEFSDYGRLVSALHKLGFAYVTETAEAAELVAGEHQKLVEEQQGRAVIASCCPVVVNLIERYYPQLIQYLAPVVSPMIAHGRLLKSVYGADLKVVFIGPCIGKKDEYSRAELQGSIDAVLTFQELKAMLAEEGIDPARETAGKFDRSGGTARIFPTPGGLAKTARLNTDLLAEEVITIDGLEAVIDFLARFDEVKAGLRLVELLACRGGCLMGPGLESGLSLYRRRQRLLAYTRSRRESADGTDSGAQTPADKDYPPVPSLFTTYAKRKLKATTHSEEAIRRVLSKTGKSKPEDELNCGACGYNSCREKAIAVLEGMAELDMCIPYMRAKAESRANLICSMTPNAILVVDSSLQILEVNPAAEQKFLCRQDQVVGKNLDLLIDPTSFKEALRTKELVCGEVAYPAYGIVTWQAIFYAEADDVLIGIFVDITKEHEQREKLALMKGETLTKAQEVIDKQMRVAQEIAGLLGETTAETKVLLSKLIKLIKNGDGSIQ